MEYMPVVGDAKVLLELLEETFRKLEGKLVPRP